MRADPHSCPPGGLPCLPRDINTEPRQLRKVPDVVKPKHHRAGLYGMARRSRQDSAGSWHHVVNRGIAKRVMFETRSDVRYFLSRLAREVRSGRIEVHSYCVMMTHFHLLVRSPIGEMSEAMRRAQNAYSRYFNRKRKRDGTLIRGRYFSKPVFTDTYRRTLIRYIDGNPAKAGIVKRSEDFEFGSARHYSMASGPIWLCRTWVEEQTRGAGANGAHSARAYAKHFDPGNQEQYRCLEELVNSRLNSTMVEDPLEDLVGPNSLQTRNWMRGKALLADGHAVGLPICSARSLQQAIEEDLTQRDEWWIEEDQMNWRGSELTRIGLLRTLCGATWKAIRAHADVSYSRARRLNGVHSELMKSSTTHSKRTAHIANEAVLASFGILP